MDHLYQGWLLLQDVSITLSYRARPTLEPCP